MYSSHIPRSPSDWFQGYAVLSVLDRQDDTVRGIASALGVPGFKSQLWRFLVCGTSVQLTTEPPVLSSVKLEVTQHLPSRVLPALN